MLSLRDKINIDQHMYTYTDMKDDISDHWMIQNLLEILSALYFVTPKKLFEVQHFEVPGSPAKKVESVVVALRTVLDPKKTCKVSWS